MNEIIEWLRSPDGEIWSREQIQHDGGNPARHSRGLFGSLKYDHQCFYDKMTGQFIGCQPDAEFEWLDKIIEHEIAMYGMNGVGKSAVSAR